MAADFGQIGEVQGRNMSRELLRKMAEGSRF